MAKKIVWIEDDIAIISSVVKPLEKAGHQIHRMFTPDEAISHLDLLRDADLILLDMIMPYDEVSEETKASYSGLTLLDDIQNKHNIRTPVVVFSVVRNIRKRLETYDIEDIIVKPVKPSELKERVEKVLKIQQDI